MAVNDAKVHAVWDHRCDICVIHVSEILLKFIL